MWLLLIHGLQAASVTPAHVKNFLKSTPRHQHRDPEVRAEWLRLLVNPDETERGIVQQLAFDDESLDVRKAAIEQLDELLPLRELADARGNEEARILSDAAIDRLRQLIGLGQVSAIALRALLTSQGEALAFYTAMNGTNGEQRHMAIDTIADERELAQVVVESRIHEDRERAAARIKNPELLRELVSEIRQRDKVVARQLQERLDAAAEAERRERQREHALVGTLEQIEQLADSVWSPQTEGRLLALDTRWAQLPEAERAPFEKRYRAAHERVADKVAEAASRAGTEAAEARPASVTPGVAVDSPDAAAGGSAAGDSKTPAPACAAGGDAAPATAAASTAAASTAVASVGSSAVSASSGAISTEAAPAGTSPAEAAIVDVAAAGSAGSATILDSKADEKASSASSGNAAEAPVAPALSSDPAAQETARSLLADAAFKGDWERSRDTTLETLPAWIESLAEHPEASPLKAYAESVAVMFDPPFNTRKGRPQALEERRQRIDKLLAVADVAPPLATETLDIRDHAWFAELLAHREALVQRLPQAKQESQDRRRATERQFDTLDAHIRDGQWSAANSLFHRLQKKIGQMESNERKPLDERFHGLERQLREMADWQDFAARPKLEALCEEMETLAAGIFEPRELAKKVRDVQKRWKDLGVSRASNELWNRFHSAGDKAYEPYRNWLALKEQEREYKSKERVAILEKLEAERAKLDDATDIGTVRRIVNRSVRDWKATRVFGVRADAKLEKRYSETIQPFRDRLDAMQSSSKEEKEQLIARAEALAAGEVNAHTVNQARHLFSAWKQSGQADRRIDGKLWQTFKGHIDSIYDRKREQDRERRKADYAHVDRARDIIGELRKLSRESHVDETRVQALNDEFRALEKFPDNSRKRLMSDFGKALDACSAARRKEDDRRQQASRDEVQRLLSLCESLEQAIESGATTERLREDTLEKWGEATASVPRELESVLVARRDAALAHLDAGTQPDYAAAEETRRDLLVRMEVAAGIDTPADDKARRMQYQLAHLQEGMMSGGAGNARAALDAFELEWLAAPPASIAVREALGSRYLKAVGR
ncbi:MAG: hypothetical protein CSB44_08220 [Gammaproteobacteria bacterium]|nr:MAG: hypothetical protein CSB44_08220 [Gammaproteobacteria bacterium]PIE37752.1 MAG: hypothetical protein CSA54_00815 [Gammaproteobacteria bacterium]